MIDSSRVTFRIDYEGRGKREYSPRIGEMRIRKRLHLDDLKPLAVLSRNLFERGILDCLARRTSRIREIQDRRLAQRVAFQANPGAGKPTHGKPTIQPVGEIPSYDKSERDAQPLKQRQLLRSTRPHAGEYTRYWGLHKTRNSDAAEPVVDCTRHAEASKEIECRQAEDDPG